MANDSSQGTPKNKKPTDIVRPVFFWEWSKSTFEKVFELGSFARSSTTGEEFIVLRVLEHP